MIRLNRHDGGVAAVFLLLLATVMSSASETCVRRFIILTIQHGDCVPRNVMTSACRGMCSSYVRPSLEDGTLERFCQCCDADNTRFRRVIVTCPNRDWVPGSEASRIRRIGVNMNLPTSCRCRPCSLMPHEIIPAETAIWNEGKRSPGGFTHLVNETTSWDNRPFIHIDADDDITYSFNEIDSVY